MFSGSISNHSKFWKALQEKSINDVFSVYQDAQNATLDVIDFANAKSDDGWTMLHDIAQRNFVEIIPQLPSIKESIPCLFKRDADHATPLDIAASLGHTSVLVGLWKLSTELQIIDPHKSGEFDHHEPNFDPDLLALAVSSSNIETVQAVLEHKMTNYGINNPRRPILETAVYDGNLHMIQFLISKEANVNDVNRFRQTPLMVAVRRGLLQVAQCLVEVGHADTELLDDRGNDALSLAEKSHQWECASYLRKLKIKNGIDFAEGAVSQIPVNVEWIRPRLVGDLIEPRSKPMMIQTSDSLYISGGCGSFDPMQGAYPDKSKVIGMTYLSKSLFRIELPMKIESMIPDTMQIRHMILSSYFNFSYESYLPPILSLKDYVIGARRTDNLESNSSKGMVKPRVRSFRQELVDVCNQLHLHSQSPSNLSDLVNYVKTASLFPEIELKEQRWSQMFGSPLIQVSSDGLELSYLPSQVASPAVALAVFPFDFSNHNLPYQYFEITVIDSGMYGYITIGTSQIGHQNDQHLGWKECSYGMHGDIGSIFHFSGTGSAYGPRFGKGDVVGFGIDVKQAQVFWTLNGKYLGSAYQFFDFSKQWYPAISMQSPGERIRANFGTFEPFVFDWNAPTLRITKHQREIGSGMLFYCPKTVDPTEMVLVDRLNSAKKMEFPGTLISTQVPGPLTMFSRSTLKRKLISHQGDIWPTSDYWDAHNLLQLFHEDPTFLSFIALRTRPNDDELKYQFEYWMISYLTGEVKVVTSQPLKVDYPQGKTSSPIEWGVSESFLIVWHRFAGKMFYIDWYPCYTECKSLEGPVNLSTLSPEWRSCPISGDFPTSNSVMISSISPAMATNMRRNNNIQTSLQRNQTEATETGARFPLCDMLVFGGFEEHAPQNTIYRLSLNDMENGTSSWSKPRTTGIVPKARNNSAMITIPASKMCLSSSQSKDNTSFDLIERNECYLAVMGGWHGFAPNNDFDLARVYVDIPKSHDFPHVSKFSKFNDFQIQFNLPSSSNQTGMEIIPEQFNPVNVPKILLYSRSSFFRNYLALNPNLPSMDITKVLIEAFPDSNVSSIMDSSSILESFNHLVSYFYQDSLPLLYTLQTQQKIEICKLTNLLCPEHADSVHDVLFSPRIIYHGTLATDFAHARDFENLIGNTPQNPNNRLLWTDLKVYPGEKVTNPILCHSLIFALRSNIFQTITNGKWNESEIQADGYRSLNIVQADEELALLWVEALYRGRIDPDQASHRIIDLFELAHAYECEDLSSYLEQLMAANIDELNVEIISQVADAHSSQVLKNACAKFELLRHTSSTMKPGKLMHHHCF